MEQEPGEFDVVAGRGLVEGFGGLVVLRVGVASQVVSKMMAGKGVKSKVNCAKPRPRSGWSILARMRSMVWVSRRRWEAQPVIW